MARALEACESGRIGTIGNRVWGNSPWVQIPPPPPMSTDATSSGKALPPSFGGGGPTPDDKEKLDDNQAMGAALREAALAVDHGDVPVGAVALVGGRVVAARHNEREKQGDPTAHAEVLALSDAAAAVGSWRLSEVTLVVTLEPCPMCAGALVAARLGRLVFGATDMKAGSCGSLYNLCADPRLNHEVPVTAGVRAEESAELLTGFFRRRRRG